MLKVKDGYAKVIGTTVNGSSNYLLRTDGGEQKLSDLVPLNAAKFGYNDTTNIWHCILQFTTNWIGSVTFMYSPIECQRDYWCLGNINLRDGDIKFYIANFSNDFASLFKVTATKDSSSNKYIVKLWVKNSNSSNWNPYGLIQILAYNNATIDKIGDTDEKNSSEPTGTYNATPTNNLLADTVDGIHANRFAYIYNSDNYWDGMEKEKRSPNTMITDDHSNAQMGLVYGSEGNPTGGVKWMHIWLLKWNSSNSKSWISLIAIDPTNPTMWYRTSNSDITTASWLKLLDSSNFTNYFSAGSNISLSTTNGVISISSTNTWRNILVKNLSIGNNNLNLKEGSNISLALDGGNVTISSTNTWRDIKGNNTSIGSHPLNIIGDGVTITPNASTGEIKISLTGNITTHTHKTLAPTDDVSINATNFEEGLCFKPYYNNGGPSTYGNILEYVSNKKGGGQLAMEWSGSQTLNNGTDTNVGRLYYRSKRDNVAGWTSWKTVAWKSDIPSSLKNPNALTINANNDILDRYDGSEAKTINITYDNVGAAAKSHNHTSLTDVEKISFKADTSDSCYIGTTVNNNITTLDFYLADDASQEKFRWLFKDCNTGVGLKTIMELSPTNYPWSALKLYDCYVPVYDSSALSSGLIYKNSNYIGTSVPTITEATASNTSVSGNWNVLCVLATSTYDTSKSKASTTYTYNLKDEFPKATVAEKLSSDAGSSIEPVYFSDGKPTGCSYSLSANVPSDAVFTDTTYDLTIGTKYATKSTTSCSNGNVYLNLLKNEKKNKWCLLKGTNATTVTYDGSGTITINSNNTWRDVTVKGTSIGTSTLLLTAGTGIDLLVEASTGKVTIGNTISLRAVTDTYNNSSNLSESTALNLKGAYGLYSESFICKNTGVKTGDAASDTMGSEAWGGAIPTSLTKSSWNPYNYGEVLSFPAGNMRFDIYASHHSSSTEDDNGLYYRTGWHSTDKTDYKTWVKIIDSNTITSYFNNSWNVGKSGLPLNLLPYINNSGVTSIGNTLNFFTGGSSNSCTLLIALGGFGTPNELTLPTVDGTIALTNLISAALVCRIYYAESNGSSSPSVTEGTGSQTDVSPTLRSVNEDWLLLFDTNIDYEDDYYKKYFLIVSPNFYLSNELSISYDTDIKANLVENKNRKLSVDVRFKYTGDCNFVALTIVIFLINKLS